MSGLEFLERLRQTNPNIQVIILTGFGDLEGQAEWFAIRMVVTAIALDVARRIGLGNSLVTFRRKSPSWAQQFLWQLTSLFDRLWLRDPH